MPYYIRQPYALTDALAHRTLHQELWSRIEREGLEAVYWLDMAVLPFVVRTEEVGMACDADALRKLSTQFEKDFHLTVAAIERIVGHAVNPLSGEQVSKMLFGTQEITSYSTDGKYTIFAGSTGEEIGVNIDEGLGVRPTLMTKSQKHFRTGDKYLKARRSEHEVIQLVLDARQLNKYRATYTDKLPRMLQEGRYYPNWKYTRTATGRLAEEIILLIPKHDPMHKVQKRANRAKAIRNCFYAEGGHELVSVDLSQIELRVMAHMSQDKRFLEAFRRGEDPHSQVAADILGAPKRKEDQDESAHRLPSKTFNFAFINGSTEYGILDQLHELGLLDWTLDSVRDFMKEWYVVHKGVKKFWDEQIRLGRERGYVESMHGRRRYMASLHSTDDRIVAQAERECLFPIQSTADEISKVWNRRIWKRVIKPRLKQEVYCEPWVRVHDDTTLEVEASIVEQVKAEMLGLVPQLLCIPTTAEGKRGVQWGDLH